MKLITRNEAKTELPAARKRLTNAKATIRRLCVAYKRHGGIVFEFAKDIAEAQAELVAAREWFGECYYQAKFLEYPDIDAAILNSVQVRLSIRESYEKLGMVEADPVRYAVETLAELRTAREKVEALLASYAERWYANG